MNRKVAACPRTWHSLWDEMFSACAAFDPDSEHTGLGFESEREWSDATIEVAAWFVEHTAQQSNDNGST